MAKHIIYNYVASSLFSTSVCYFWHETNFNCIYYMYTFGFP